MFRYLEINANDTIYATGYTYGDLAGSNADPTGRTGDVIVYTFDTHLDTLDATQFGTPHEDRGISDLFDGILTIGGMTEAAMANVSRGSFDGYVVKLDAATLDVLPDFLAGDANRDGTVNLADFTALRNNFGVGSLFSQSDFNFDGRIDLADFTILRNHFGLSVEDDLL
jgi:hypothetical protein